MSLTKASYCVSDGLGPLMLQYISEDMTLTDTCFTVLYDETTTAQMLKQMDVLVRYWSEASNGIVTKYITSFFFAQATGEHLIELFTEHLLKIQK